MQRRAFWVRFGAGLALLLGSFCFTPSVQAFTNDQKLFLEAWRIVNQSYVDDTFNHQNWWRMRQKYLRKPFADREAAYDAIESMLGTLDDPFTRLLRPEEYRTLQVSTSGELSGVGLQVDLDPRTRQIRVVAPIAQSPASLAGIQAGDYIVAIDGQPTMQMSLEKAANRMRGQRGTSVVLTVQGTDRAATEEITLIRDRISLNPVTTALDNTSSDLKVGYLRLSQFSANATQAIAHGFYDLGQAGAEAYILDLRNNPGGLLQAGIDIANFLLDEQPIVYTVNRQGVIDAMVADDQFLTRAPLVVLVNRGTASASEILAGALQDNGRAQLVGEQTFGKGLIQSLFELPDDSGLAVTVAKYETPLHHDIHRLGITPDVAVPLTIPLRIDDLTTAQDEQYQAAIALLTEAGVMPEAIAEAT